MKSNKCLSNLSNSAPITYTIEVTWGSKTSRSFKLTIFRLPNYLSKTPSNDVIDINNNNFLGFTNQLAIGLGTGRLALPAISTKEKKISLTFQSEFLHDMSMEDLITVQHKIASTIDFINEKLETNINYLDEMKLQTEQIP
ncbi:hypothetical protein EHQ23_09055 [Leptospira bourretii]|uniref:Uncharacterized protein n=1 Tax=Leptospira bourretii TaxID=2484962 RepID=A0A4R9IMB6_9LEPT|nr:hypothetical protein [Leptospira bourretii]TGK84834.1 hypothetical protein EHQ23_09055 [Leptospira bourretii]TGK90601.1 hypothetical protein EHQ26_10655 [Leptospira bourretii]